MTALTASPVFLVLLGICSFLGFLVFLRIAVTLLKAAVGVATTKRRATRGTNAPAIPLLDLPTPSPSCNKLEHVAVARGDFKEMPFVEHFVCQGCGTQFLGPNQEVMVAKRLEAKRKLQDQLAGRRLMDVEVSDLKKQ